MSETPSSSSFHSFGLSELLLKAMDEMGFTSPTPIQEKAIPLLLGPAQDFIGLASTGTGKTAAFGVPLIEKIDASSKSTQGLVLSPTRELALQVADQLAKLGKYKNVRVITIYGGASYRTQLEGVKRGAHIIVATPGRLVDFLEQKAIQLSNVQTLILDEADEMISMGFKDDLDFILKCTHAEGVKANERAACKTWLFSATMSRDIRRVADTYLEKPEMVEVAKATGSSALTKQVYYTVKDENKNEVIGRLLQLHDDFHGIIFCQTKLEVVELEERLQRRGFAVASLHGDKQQREREVTLRRFRSGEAKVLVATDVAARGLDVKDLTHVINHSLPWDVESYIHRIGRTGRAGKEGTAISLINPRQVSSLRRLQTVTKTQLIKGTIPTAAEVAAHRLQKITSQITAVTPDNKKYLAALKLFENISAKQEQTETDSDTETAAVNLFELPAKELLARVVAALHSDVLGDKDYELDFMTGKPLETRDSRGDRDGRSLSGGRPSNNYRGGGRSNDRGGDRGGDRGPRNYDRGGDRPAYSADRGSDSRPARSFDRGPDRGSESRPKRNFDRDADTRPARSADRNTDTRPARSFDRSTEGAPARRPESAPTRRTESAPTRRTEGAPARRAESSSSDSYPRRERGPRFEGFDSSAPRGEKKKTDHPGIKRHRTGAVKRRPASDNA
jgi:ATP-dependent RNA helicase DeaD